MNTLKIIVRYVTAGFILTMFVSCAVFKKKCDCPKVGMVQKQIPV
jgi:hypothetical protein